MTLYNGLNLKINNMKKYCDYCHKEIGERGKIYIAGSICQGHTLSVWQWVVYKIKKLLN